jgi:hypothetical protein
MLAVASTAAAQSTTIQYPRSRPAGSLPTTGNIYSPPTSAAPSLTSQLLGASPYQGSPSTLPGTPISPTPSPPGTTAPPGTPVLPGTPLSPSPAPSSPSPAPSLVAPAPVGTPAPFDPYSTSPYSSSTWWPFSGPSVFGSPAAPPSSQPLLTAPGASPFAPPASPFTQPPTGTLQPPYTGSPYGNPALGNPAATQTPSAVFPNGLWASNPQGGPYYDWNQAVRLLQDLRLRHTYVHGSDDPTDLGINDTDVAVTLTIPNFLASQQPLYISPAFALHLWDGPVGPPADLPPSAYSAYLDFQWQTDPNLQLGAELGFRVGIYTDFDTLNTDSLRLQGVGLGRVRLTPALSLKVGAMYLDRNKIKILPAGGFVWQPSSQVRFDILFPNPKLAQYLTTVGTSELWWYVAGEYGGGAWTIERASGDSDRIDINDIRILLGLEWTSTRGASGFAEAGIVFEREVVYVVDPSDSFDPDDTFVVRAGIAF